MEFLYTDAAKILDPKFMKMDEQISGYRIIEMGRFLDSKFKVNSVPVSKLWSVLGNSHIII